MLYIKKNECPDEILAEICAIQRSEEWANIPDPSDESLSKDVKQSATRRLRDCFDQLDKEKIRESLLSEQHYLCAYCMSPIKNEGLHTSIEHWIPLSKSKLETLSYRNFFATCKGGSDVQGIPRKNRLLCCDAKKGDDYSMTLDPRNEEMMKGITYLNEGIIGYKETPPFDRASILNDINKVLQLNGKLNEEGFCTQDITIWGFDQLKEELNPEWIGLKGSPTNVFQSFGKQLRAPGVVLSGLSADEAVDAIMQRLIQRHLI